MTDSMQKSGMYREKYSNFAQTCNLLSQYLKKGGSLGDISLGIKEADEGFEITRQTATTMDLFPNGDNSTDTSRKSDALASANFKPLDNLPQLAAYGSPNFNEAITMSDLRKRASTAPEAPQMTIFYCGQVIVLDDLPADKAKEIMNLAKQASSRTANGFIPTSTNEKVFNPTDSAASDNNNVQERLQSQHQAPGSSALPIARRESLRRFLEKRKDRVAARAPYQINKTSDPALLRPGNQNSWIDFETQPSKHLELRL